MGAFEKWVAALFAEPWATASQERYAFAALIRGLVHLGRDAQAVEVVRRGEHGGRAVPEALRLFLRGADVVDFPAVSVSRALCRALRRLGQPGAAVELAEKTPWPVAPQEGLVDWLAALVHLERSLALRELGQQAAADVLAAEVRSRLLEYDSGATRFHAALLSAPPTELEAALDTSWY